VERVAAGREWKQTAHREEDDVVTEDIFDRGEGGERLRTWKTGRDLGPPVRQVQGRLQTRKGTKGRRVFVFFRFVGREKKMIMNMIKKKTAPMTPWASPRTARLLGRETPSCQPTG
jgi:hypothetical protein